MGKAILPIFLLTVLVLPVAHGQGGGGEDGTVAGDSWGVWSSVGCAASIRPGDQGKVTTNGPAMKFKSSKQGAARLFFTPLPTAGLNLAGAPVTLRLTLRYRDNGSNARVRMSGYAMSIDTGSQEQLVEWDSNDFPNPAGVRTRSVWIDNIILPWDEYVFWVEVRLDKTGSTGKPELHAIMLEAF
ncbi:MAG: hypothetical protein ACYS0J_14090 [Planctomycetota bacterium]|jgi:hypothetical protein